MSNPLEAFVYPVPRGAAPTRRRDPAALPSPPRVPSGLGAPEPPKRRTTTSSYPSPARSEMPSAPPTSFARLGAEAARAPATPPPRPQGIVVPSRFSWPDQVPDLEPPPRRSQTLSGLSRVDLTPGAQSITQVAPANGAAPGDGPTRPAKPAEQITSVQHVVARAGDTPDVTSFKLVTGQDMTLHVHVELAYPAPPPAPVAEPRVPPATASTTLDMGALLALFCVASSMGATLLLGLGSRAGAMPASTLYGMPLLVMLLVFGSFSFGYISRRNRARQR